MISPPSPALPVHPKPIRAVLFDLDGTLLDTLADIGNAGNRVLAARNFSTHPLELYRGFIGEGVTQLVRRMLPESSRDEATLLACLEAYRKEYARAWNVETRPYPGVPELLDALSARRLKLAVLSNKPDSFTQLCVRELLAGWSFEVVLGASEAFPSKPNPAGALEIARRLDVSPAGCLYLGDSGGDMQTAVAAGMLAVGALWGFRDEAELRHGGAQVLLKHPLELLPWLESEDPRLKAKG